MTHRGPDSGSTEAGREERLLALIRHSFDAVALTRPDGTVDYASPAIAGILGRTPGEFIGGNGFEHVHPDDIEAVRTRYNEVLARPGASVTLETRFRHEDGSWRWVESRLTNLLDDPSVRGVVSNFRDITERKLAEEQLRRKQEELADFIENATVGLHWIGPDGTILWVNRAELEMLGYSREEYVGRNIAEFHADPPVIADILARLSRNEELHSYEARLRRKDGSIRCVIISSNVLWRDGKFVHTRCFTRDITERKRMEEEYRTEQQHWRMALGSIGDAVIATDAGGNVTLLNPVAATLCGTTQEEAIGRPLRDIFRIVNEKTRGPVESPVEQVLATGQTVGLANHTVLIAPDGRETPIDDSAAPIVTDRGDVAGVVLVFRDVTEKRRVAELNERLAAIVESSDDIIASKDLDGVITSWNKGAERILGYTAEEVIGKHVSMLMPPELVEDMPRILERIRRGEKVDHYRTRRRRKDGTIIDVSLTVSPIRDEEGEIIGASKVGRDVTAQRRAQEEREQLLEAAQAARADAEAANRLKDEFLATLSHELRTPLNAIVGWSRILSTGPVDPEDLQEGLAAIDRNARIQARIVEDVLDVSRIISGNLRLDVQRVNMVEVIEAAIAAVIPAAEAKGVRLKKVLDPLAGPVSGDPARLQQVVWNLLSNAVKFTPKGGRVQVLLERVNSHIEVSVIDTGMGIQPEFLPHVFERFRQADSSTTRRHGGLGLGLAIVKQLAELQGGSVRAKSPGEGQGSTFVVSLPITVVHEGTPEKVRPREQAEDEFDCSDKPLAGIRVLVVDDEPDARHLVRRVLRKYGAQVSVAESAAEAMGLIEGFRADILVSDIGMPDQDGYDLIRQIRSRVAAKTLPAVALTAFARSEDRKRALLAGFQTHVAKPVDPAELVAVVASLVERTGKQP
jgi:PAS domain S-box-containing protein